MDSKNTCPIGGRHKPISDLIGEVCCHKCGIVLAKPEAVDFDAQKGDYGLGGTIGKKGSGLGKIAPNTKYLAFDKILAIAKKLINAYTQKVSSQKIISARTLELFKKYRKLLKGKKH